MQPHSKAKGPPRLIGLAGPSGAGKTTLARALQTRLPGQATVFSLDAYYRDLASLSSVTRARVNTDAHSVSGLNHLGYGIGIARKGWLRATGIPNALSREAIAAWFQS